MRHILFACIVVTVTPQLGLSQAVAGAHEVASIGWLAGCWELRQGERVTVEMWMPPAGGLMLGSARTVTGATLREYEQVMLRDVDGSVVYTARPSGQAEASFTATVVSDSGFTVENLQHDFPQRIIYRHTASDSLVARVEGAERGFEWRMGRVACRMGTAR